LDSIDHRKFIKPLESFLLGDYIPNIDLVYDGIFEKLHNMVTDHMFVLLLSTSCEPCIHTIQLLDSIIKQYPKMNVVMLIDANDDVVRYLKTIFVEPKVRVFPYSKQKIKIEFQTHFLPRGYVVNCEKQIVYISSCGDINQILNMLKPFKNIIDFGAEEKDE